MKILIVDDTPANLRLLRAVLEGENFEVVEATDGLEALAVLKREPVDGVISDILMPNMDGYRLCNEVRRSERFYHLPLIIYSSTYNSPADAELAVKMGADKYIKKPAPIKEITDALSEIIGRGPRQRTPLAAPQLDLSLAKLYNETLVNKLEQKNEELSRQTEALRASEEKFRQLTDNINEVCWIATADLSETLYISPAYEKIWGRTCQSAYENPRSFFESVAEADRPRVGAALESIKRGEKSDLEYRVVRPDGQIRWVHDRGTSIRNEAGVIYRLAGAVEDITLRKNTEAQLLQAQKMEAIGQLAGGVAHDFNNLLTVIGANLELVTMTERNLQPSSREYLEDIANAAQRAATLTRQLLAFSRSEAMRMQVLDLNDLIDSFSKMIRRILGKNIQVTSELSPALPSIEADPGMIEQILMNLAVNARDAMPSGGKLTIATEWQVIDSARVEKEPNLRVGSFACLRVSDTGTGIAPEHLARIFEPFFTTKGVGKGTGLGLATVFGIAEQHRGWVGVETELGVGTTFRVFLPVAQNKAVAPGGEKRTEVHGEGERVLVVEDDIAVRALLHEILRRNGYIVFEADSGLAAQELWLKVGEDIDLLLTDMMLPGGLTGLELSEQLRGRKRSLKVVLISGYSSELAASSPSSLKGISFLKKPFSFETLAQTVRKALDEP